MRIIALVGGWALGLSGGSFAGRVLCAGLLLAALVGTARAKHAAGGAGGMLRSDLAPGKPDAMAPYRGQRVVVRGVIGSAPEAIGLAVGFNLAVEQIARGGESLEPVAGMVPVTALLPQELSLRRGLPSGYAQGDRVRLEGTLEAPEPTDAFALPAYLAQRNIHSVMVFPKTALMDERHATLLQQTTFQARSRLAPAMSQALPEPEASLAQAFTVGLRQGLPQGVADDFRRSGAAHLLAVSGQNVGIFLGIALALAQATPWRSRWVGFLLPLATVWLSVLLAGSPVSAQRAAVMATFYLAMEASGRQRNALDALLLAAFCITVVDPDALWQVSFHLSFLAMAGIIFLGMPAMRRIPAWPGIHGSVLRAVLGFSALSVAATLATFPAIAFYFHRVSLISLPASLFTLPVMPLAVSGSLITAVVTLASSEVGRLVGVLAWMPLHWTITWVHLFGSIPFASAPIHVSAGAVLAAYASMVLGRWALAATGVLGKEAERGRTIPYGLVPEGRTLSRFAVAVGVPGFAAAGVWWSALAQATPLQSWRSASWPPGGARQCSCAPPTDAECWSPAEWTRDGYARS